MTRWIIFILIVLCLDFYAYQSVRTVTKNKWVYLGYWLISIGVLVNLIYQLNTIGSQRGLSSSVMLAFGLIILSIIPKLLVFVMMIGEDLFRIVKAGIHFMNKAERPYFEGRREFVSKIALGIAAIPFSSIVFGMIQGKYNYKVLKHTLFFEDLPDAFDGFKLTHISDIHSGSFTNKEKIGYGVDLINDQDSDLILFTGDLVNNTAEEMDPWISVFGKLKAKYGKYSILGNHDYGEYTAWKTEEEKVENFQAIKDVHPKIGFNLLLNESVFLEKDNQKIALVGVENWGTRFKKAGDLVKASEKTNKEDFKILMSHDPTHWNSEVKENKHHYQLTLSGHTHGMQFGIEIPGIKWSPVQYIYKHWAGMYNEFGRYLNVNRGFGYLAFPGRVGIWPEITVITLKKK